MADSELLQLFLRSYTGAQDPSVIRERLQSELYNMGYGRKDDPQELQLEWFQVCVRNNPESAAAKQWIQYQAASSTAAAVVDPTPVVSSVLSVETSAVVEEDTYDNDHPETHTVVDDGFSVGGCAHSSSSHRWVIHHVPHDVKAIVSARMRYHHEAAKERELDTLFHKF